MKLCEKIFTQTPWDGMMSENHETMAIYNPQLFSSEVKNYSTTLRNDPNETQQLIH